MSLLVRTGDVPVLRVRTLPVKTFDSDLRKLANEMLEAMYAAPGVGLAANQVGYPLRMFVYDDGGTGPRVMVNPVLTAARGKATELEGCLSMPGEWYRIPRYEEVICRGQDLRGRVVEVKAEGLLARICQHETDHLNGTLVSDLLEKV